MALINELKMQISPQPLSEPKLREKSEKERKHTAPTPPAERKPEIKKQVKKSSAPKIPRASSYYLVYKIGPGMRDVQVYYEMNFRENFLSTLV